LRTKVLVLAVCLAATVIVLAGLGAFSSSARASATNDTTHCDPSNAICGLNPVLTGPPPPFVTVPANCPSFFSTDSWSLDFVSGNAVSHGTSNKNGDWGGGAAEGQAVLTTSDGTAQYAGHLTEWGGGGQNSPNGANQTEGGFTLTFNGSGIAGNLSIHVDVHSTTNNSGTPTANHQNNSVSCS
jgi:hypothetical protein